jgi:tripartite-type tricarboxylate transporter receptor subunit TctC
LAIEETPGDAMHMLIRAISGAFTALLVLASVVSAAFAQTPSPDAAAWPQRAVKFIVPFGPGAGADIGARLVGERLSMRWGKPVVIENRPGADGLVAIQAFLSANDDHTLLFAASGSFTVHPYQYEKLPYTPADLAPIARVSNTILAIGVPTARNINTLKEFVERARAEPGKLNAAVVPGITELTFDYFLKTEALAVAKIPYRDIVQAATDVGEDRVQIMSSSYAIQQPQAQAGRIKILAVAGRERAPIIPDIPTAIEAGSPSLEQEGLVGLFGPQFMPLALREKIGADVVAVAKDPAVGAKLAGTAQVVNPGGPTELAAAVDHQRAMIARIAQALGTRPKQ